MRFAGLPSFAILALLAPSVVTAQQGRDTIAIAIDREVRRIAAETPLWPGYRPDTIPLAIFTGERTLLFRHRAPPPGFTPLADGVAVFSGRYPAVTSNSSAKIGDIATATMMADGARGLRPVREQAAVALHEAFHVFQRVAHPSWSGNEGDLFTYPFERGDLLTLRRRESDRVRRALAASGEVARCHARAAMALRAERFAAMAPPYVLYERRSELNEGLATWVQHRAEGKRTVAIPAEEHAATAIRDRFYTVGPALGFLLDGIRPGWTDELQRTDSLTLDGLLTAALAGGDGGSCPVPAAEERALADRAGADAAAVVAGRRDGRAAFDRRPGWRVVIEPAGGAPLWPNGFDPLNVTVVDGGVRHDRMLALGNEALKLSMVDGEGADLVALTEAAGAHPLFNGIRRVEIAGLAKPAVKVEGETTTISAPGFTATVKGVRVRESGERLVVTVGTP